MREYLNFNWKSLIISIVASLLISWYFYEKYKKEALSQDIKNLCYKYDQKEIRYSISTFASIVKKKKETKYYLVYFDKKQNSIKPIGGVIEYECLKKEKYITVEDSKKPKELRFTTPVQEYNKTLEFIQNNISPNSELLKSNIIREIQEETKNIENFQEIPSKISHSFVKVDYSEYNKKVEYLKHYVFNVDVKTDVWSIFKKDQNITKNSVLWISEYDIKTNGIKSKKFIMADTLKVILQK